MIYLTSLKIQKVDLTIDSDLVLINQETLDKQKIRTSDYIKLKNGSQELIGQVISTGSLVEPNFIGLPEEIFNKLKVKEGDEISIFSRRKPASLECIKTKRKGQIWSESEIRTIVHDICGNQYTDLEISMFTLAQYYLGLNMDEVQYLTTHMAEYGTTLQFDEPVYDKHSIGGIPGNKVSPLIVPTIAAAGLLIPKTSSRAITSPSGTADTMEVLCDVDFSADEILEIAPKVRGMIVWGGTLDLSPLDEIVIHKVEQPLGIDPHSQMLASIFSKKVSTGVDYLVLDIPTGAGTKMPTRQDALEYAQECTELGRRLSIVIEAALSYGEQPLGRAVGPALEAKEALMTLMGEGSHSVLEKSVELAGILFEMANLAKQGQGSNLATKYVKSGKSLKKFREIIGAQNGDPNIKPDDIQIGPHKHEIKAPRDGYIVQVSNSGVKKVCKAAGNPKHKAAGVYLNKKLGEFVRKDEALMTIYSDNESRLTEAIALATSLKPYVLEGMILQRISSGPKNLEKS